VTGFRECGEGVCSRSVGWETESTGSKWSIMLWTDGVARGQWDMAGDQYAMPWRLRWRVWTVCTTQVEVSGAVWGAH